MEKRELTALTRKHGAPQAVAERARIVLAAASGLKNREIASKLGVCTHTVGTWRNRFADHRMDGLYDEPRSGAPREIGDDEIASTIRKTLETRPKGGTHWSLRSMAKDGCRAIDAWCGVGVAVLARFSMHRLHRVTNFHAATKIARFSRHRGAPFW